MSQLGVHIHKARLNALGALGTTIVNMGTSSF